MEIKKQTSGCEKDELQLHACHVTFRNKIRENKGLCCYRLSVCVFENRCGLSLSSRNTAVLTSQLTAPRDRFCTKMCVSFFEKLS